MIDKKTRLLQQQRQEHQLRRKSISTIGYFAKHGTVGILHGRLSRMVD
jgi:hypothetical protein